jgi:hypothetical protein
MEAELLSRPRDLPDVAHVRRALRAAALGDPAASGADRVP